MAVDQFVKKQIPVSATGHRSQIRGKSKQVWKDYPVSARFTSGRKSGKLLQSVQSCLPLCR
ncbi:MAG: hypothetical protein DYG98_19550 [Haliscomenobacteraceae bacterium CHB4]|nr:hypothetical protein [Haliscomenobacteraceae bacterium CHB4]